MITLEDARHRMLQARDEVITGIGVLLAHEEGSTVPSTLFTDIHALEGAATEYLAAVARSGDKRT